MHRTQTEFDDNLTFKAFIFQFVNFYSSIFYIAFFKGRFVGYPGNYTRILRLRNEDVSTHVSCAMFIHCALGHPTSLLFSVQCSAGGCLIELAQQLAVIMIGKQIINNAQEIFVPKMKAWWQKKQASTYVTNCVGYTALGSMSTYYNGVILDRLRKTMETAWSKRLQHYHNDFNPG
jgi:anoctamin-7